MAIKLLLTSSGLTDRPVQQAFHKLLYGIEKPRIALLYTIKDPGDEQWLINYGNEAEQLGVSYEFINLSEDKDLSDQNNYDAYYVAGGNTFYILDRLKKTGMFGVLARAIIAGKLYIGLSAGSIIAGSDIEIAGFGPSGDPNDIELQDLSSLAVVPFHVYPHFVKQEEEMILKFYKKRRRPVIALSDGQAVLVQDNAHSLLGEGAGYVLCSSNSSLLIYGAFIVLSELKYFLFSEDDYI